MASRCVKTMIAVMRVAEERIIGLLVSPRLGFGCRLARAFGPGLFGTLIKDPSTDRKQTT
jgi:hypothetical protein